MDLNKRILRAINEGVSTALLLDNDKEPTIIGKSSEQISKDIKRNTGMPIYSKKLQEMLPDPMDVDKEFIDQALNWYSEYGAQYNPYLDDEKFRIFIQKCIKIQGYNANLNWIDTSDVTDMQWLFFNIEFNGDISGWNVSNVTNMSCMFWKSKFNGNISDWDVSNVTNMCRMFEHSEFNKDISGWDVSNVTDMKDMFSDSLFNKDISGWDVSNVTDTTFIFDGCPIPKENKPKFNI